MNDEEHARQAGRVLDLMHRSMRERGYPPSRREISAALDARSAATGQRVIDRMERDGLIEVDRSVIRGIRVVGKANVEVM